MISLLSVENTGTHFTAGVIQRLTGRNVAWTSPTAPEVFDTPDIGCMIQHVYPSDFLSHANCIVELMLRADHVVVPMRDPVDALISNHDRGHETLPFREHVRSFARVASWQGLKNVHFFQVDGPEEDRGVELVKLGLFLGADDIPEVDWRPKNTTPAEKRSDLRVFRENGDFSALDRQLYGAISALGPLSGFFSAFGYEIPVIEEKSRA